MATDAGDGHRAGSVTDCTQVKNDDEDWTERDAASGEFLDLKADGQPFEGVATDPYGHRSHEGRVATLGRGLGPLARQEQLALRRWRQASASGAVLAAPAGQGRAGAEVPTRFELV